jgi:non-heme chloroperoxidase
MIYFALNALAAPLVSAGDVRLANGVRLHYAQQGPVGGPAIILLHGYSDSSLSFGRVMPLMSPQVRVIAPDLRGHGDSDCPDSGYRIDDLAGDVVQLMDALDVPSAVIIGHSMGTFVARRVNEIAPERVTRLVLVGGAVIAANKGVMELQAAVNALTDPVDESFVRAFQLSTVSVPVPEAFMSAAIANSRRMPARVWQLLMNAIIEFRPLEPKPAVPTLVLGGRLDAVFSVNEQIALARTFPNGELHLIDGVGHALHWEQPEVFVKALERFGL